MVTDGTAFGASNLVSDALGVQQKGELDSMSGINRITPEIVLEAAVALKGKVKPVTEQFVCGLRDKCACGLSLVSIHRHDNFNAIASLQNDTEDFFYQIYLTCN